MKYAMSVRTNYHTIITDKQLSISMRISFIYQVYFLLKYSRQETHLSLLCLTINVFAFDQTSYNCNRRLINMFVKCFSLYKKNVSMIMVYKFFICYFNCVSLRNYLGKNIRLISVNMVKMSLIKSVSKNRPLV